MTKNLFFIFFSKRDFFDYKKILFLLNLIIFFSCQSPFSNSMKIINPCEKGTHERPIAIIFENEFKDDTLMIKMDKKNIFNDIITSDLSTGQATTVYIDTTKLEKTDIIIFLNDHIYLLPDPCKKIIVVNYFNDTLYVEYMDKPKMYY